MYIRVFLYDLSWTLALTVEILKYSNLRLSDPPHAPPLLFEKNQKIFFFDKFFLSLLVTRVGRYTEQRRDHVILSLWHWDLLWSVMDYGIHYPLSFGTSRHLDYVRWPQPLKGKGGAGGVTDDNLKIVGSIEKATMVYVRLVKTPYGYQFVKITLCIRLLKHLTVAIGCSKSPCA
jgi:hypothetical protein